MKELHCTRCDLETTLDVHGLCYGCDREEREQDEYQQDLENALQYEAEAPDNGINQEDN